MTAPAADFSRAFPADRDAPTAARRVINEMADLDPETQFRLELLVTEIVSNSVVHADGDRVTLDIRADPRQVRVTVLDDGPGFDPHEVSSDGYGLMMLAQLSDRWGRDDRGGRNAVWFVLRRTHRTGAATAALSYASRFAATLLGRGRRAPLDPYSD